MRNESVPVVVDPHEVTPQGAAAGQAEADQQPKGQLPGWLGGRQGWILGFGVATVLLYIAFLRLSWTFQVNSDGANIQLMAWDMLHGNWLLHGWYTFDVPYLTTELPQYAGLEAVFGLTPVVTHVAAAMTYTLAVLLAMIVAKGSATGRQGLVRAVVAGGIMLAPQYNKGVFILVLSVGHIGASVPLLAILLLLDRSRPSWRIAALTGVLLAWATMGDSLTYLLGSIPLALACGYRVLRGWITEREIRRYELQLAVAAVLSIGAAEAGLKVVRALGGFTLYPVQFHFTGLRHLTQHLALTWHAALILFGADFYHHQQGIWLAAAALHFAGMTLALWAVGWGVLRYLRGADLLEQVMTGGIVLNVLAFATSNVAKMDAHELAIALPFSAVLAARAIGRVRVGGVKRRVAAAAGIAVLAGYLACLIGTDTLPPAGPGQAQLASFLEQHHLNYGIAGYWEASMVSVDSGNKVQVRAITDYKRFLWGTKSTWYNAQHNYANFIVEERGYDFTSVSAAQQQVESHFGTPAKVYTFGDYLVMVYDKNLLRSLHGSTY
jgi:hypothetical protein